MWLRIYSIKGVTLSFFVILDVTMSKKRAALTTLSTAISEVVPEVPFGGGENLTQGAKTFMNKVTNEYFVF